jgi:2'-5' RNA ligase
MDLLSSLQSSSSSDSEGEDTKSENEVSGKRGTKRSLAERDVAATPGDRNIRNHSNISVERSKARGTVSLIPTSQAPPDLFVRSTPHQRGHWSGHILVPIASWSHSSTIAQSIRTFQKYLERQGHSGVLVQHDHLHLSLSRPFSLHLAQLESFFDQLSKRLAHVPATTLYVDRTGGVLVNYEKTRSFWGWKVQPNQILRSILGHIDAVLQNYNQPKYYDTPIFHVSLASFAGHVVQHHEMIAENESSSSSSSSSDESEEDEEEDKTDTVLLDQIHCKFGTTKNYVIQLQKNQPG